MLSFERSHLVPWCSYSSSSSSKARAESSTATSFRCLHSAVSSLIYGSKEGSTGALGPVRIVDSIEDDIVGRRPIRPLPLFEEVEQGEPKGERLFMFA
jgi:hypothetical protein